MSVHSARRRPAFHRRSLRIQLRKVAFGAREGTLGAATRALPAPSRDFFAEFSEYRDTLCVIPGIEAGKTNAGPNRTDRSEVVSTRPVCDLHHWPWPHVV